MENRQALESLFRAAERGSIEDLFRINEPDASVLMVITRNLNQPERKVLNDVWERAFIEAAVGVLTAKLVWPKDSVIYNYHGLQNLRAFFKRASADEVRELAHIALQRIGIDHHQSRFQIPYTTMASILSGAYRRVEAFCQEAEQAEAEALPQAA